MKRQIYSSKNFDENSEFIDYEINDGEGYIQTYKDYEREYNSDSSLKQDFASVDEYIQSMLDEGFIKVFNDVSDEEYNHYFPVQSSSDISGERIGEEDREFAESEDFDLIGDDMNMERHIYSTEDTSTSKEDLLALLKSRGIDTAKQKYELKAETYERYERGDVYTIRFSCPGDYLAYFSMYFHKAPNVDGVLDWHYEIEDEWLTVDDIAKYAERNWWGDGDDYIIYLKNLTTGKMLYEGEYHEDEPIESDDYDWE